MTRVGVVGAVFAGGSSTRFGSDKFLHPFGHSTMGRCAVEVLTLVAVDRVLVVSGDPNHDTPGALRIVGTREGNGPLGALVDTLEYVGTGTLVTLPCDVPYLRVSEIEVLLDAFADEFDVVLAEADGIHPTIGVWSIERCHERLSGAYAIGERAVHRAVETLRCERVTLPRGHLRNVNSRDDLTDASGTSAA